MNKGSSKKIYSAEIKGKGQEPKGIKVKMVKLPYTVDKKKQKETEKKALAKLNLMIKERQPKFDIEKYKAVQAIRERATGRDESKRDELLQKLLTPQEYEQYKKRKEEKEAEKQALHNAILQSRHLPMMLDELRQMKAEQQAAAQEQLKATKELPESIKELLPEETPPEYEGVADIRKAFEDALLVVFGTKGPTQAEKDELYRVNMNELEANDKMIKQMNEQYKKEKGNTKEREKLKTDILGIYDDKGIKPKAKAIPTLIKELDKALLAQTVEKAKGQLQAMRK